jgi:hypothetical protein
MIIIRLTLGIVIIHCQTLWFLVKWLVSPVLSHWGLGKQRGTGRPSRELARDIVIDWHLLKERNKQWYVQLIAMRNQSLGG